MRRWMLTCALWLAAGCAAAPPPPAPAEIALGVDVCDYCHMAVDDAARAAQWVPAGGPVRVFDEPGCLAAWLRDSERDFTPARAAGRAFVADEAGSGWVAADEAYYVHAGTRTAMGFDVIAFRDADAARAHALRTGGSVVSWQSVRDQEGKHAHAH